MAALKADNAFGQFASKIYTASARARQFEKVLVSLQRVVSSTKQAAISIGI
jgi:hypothetical protein